MKKNLQLLIELLGERLTHVFWRVVSRGLDNKGVPDE